MHIYAAQRKIVLYLVCSCCCCWIDDTPHLRRLASCSLNFSLAELTRNGCGCVCVCVKHSSKQHTHTQLGWLQRCVCNVSCGIVAPFVMSSRGKKRGQRKTNAERDGTKRNEPNKTKFFLFFVGWQEEKRTKISCFLLLLVMSSCRLFHLPTFSIVCDVQRRPK